MVIFGSLLAGIGFLFLISICLKKPLFIMQCIVFFNIIWPPYIVFKKSFLPGVTPSRALMFCFLFTFLMRYACEHELQARVTKLFFEYRYLFNIAILYFISSLISAIVNSTNIIGSFYTAINDFIAGPVLMFFILLFFVDRKKQNILFITMIFALLLANIVGLVEWFNQGMLFGEYINSDTSYHVVEKIRGGHYRLLSVFTNPLVFAQVLVLSIPLYAYAMRQASKQLKVILLANLCLTYFLIYYTDSRAAMALSISFPFIFYFIKYFFKIESTLNKRVLISIFISLFFVTFFYCVSSMDQFVHFTTIGSEESTSVSTYARVHQFERGINAIKKQPFLGYGPGEGSKLMYPKQVVDCLYLSIALDRGLLGLLFFCWFLYGLSKYFSNKNIYGQLPMYLFVSSTIILLYFLILSINAMLILFYIFVALFLNSIKEDGAIEELTKAR